MINTEMCKVISIIILKDVVKEPGELIVRVYVGKFRKAVQRILEYCKESLAGDCSKGSECHTGDINADSQGQAYEDCF